jgi:hypothetical protein
MVPISPGSHSRYIFLLARRDELTDLTLQVAQMCRDVYDNQLLTELITQEPWLKKEAYSVSDFPPY